MKALSHLQKRRFSALRGAAALFLAASAVVAGMTAFDVPVDAGGRVRAVCTAHGFLCISRHTDRSRENQRNCAVLCLCAVSFGRLYLHSAPCGHEHLGATVEWIESTQSIVITSAGKTITMTVDSDEMTVNGVKRHCRSKCFSWAM